MADKVIVDYEEIKRIVSDIEKKLAELNNTYGQIQKNKSIIVDLWQSNAAMKYVTAIDAENKNIQESVKSVKRYIAFSEKTSKKIIEADKAIKRRLVSNELE